MAKWMAVFWVDKPFIRFPLKSDPLPCSNTQQVSLVAVAMSQTDPDCIEVIKL